MRSLPREMPSAVAISSLLRSCQKASSQHMALAGSQLLQGLHEKGENVGYWI